MRSRMILVGMIFLAAGCKEPPPVPFTEWAKPESVSPSTAALLYAQAAKQAETDSPKYLLKVSFTPGMKAAVIKQTQPALGALRRATRSSGGFAFQSRPPFKPTPNQQGWRLLGRSLVWSIEQACRGGNYDRAISDAVTAARFGFFLTGGGATDASLGFSIVNESRQAIAPYLTKMGAAQLRALSAGIKGAMTDRPQLRTTFEHEYKNMMLAVQIVQDAYETNQFAQIQKELGSDVKDAVQYLKDIRRKDREDRPAYFANFAEEAKIETDWVAEQGLLPAAKRSEDGPKLLSERPWWRFSKQFFLTCRPLLALNDACTARTRLLILDCELQRMVKVADRVPKNLNGFSASINRDPYTGQGFMYRTLGTSYKVYSAGADWVDNGGKTDETFSAPDLFVERPEL